MAAGRKGSTFDDRFEGLREFTAREPDNYAEAVRQREILTTSSDVNQLFVDTKQALERGEIDLENRRAILRSAVERLIMDVEHVMQAIGATELLESRDLYTVELSPPDELLQYIRSDDIRIIGTPSLEPKQAGRIDGLLGFLEAPEYFTAEWTVQVDFAHERQRSVTQEAAVRMPVEASRIAYREIRAFLAYVELDLGPNLPDYMGDEGPGL